jgi:GTPase SAR1 family protein
MGRIIAPSQRKLQFSPQRETVCESCKKSSRTHICPHCHFELSHDVGLIDQRIIAIIGGRATGKTHYIASLITRLQQETGKYFDFTVRILGDNTQERWERDFYTPLFVQKTVLQPNQPAEIDPLVKTPLIFRFTFDNGINRRALNLSFFDTAGEDMTSLATLSAQNRYITHADGIIFLLDPLQIPTIRQTIGKGTEGTKETGTFSMVTLPPTDVKAAPEYIVGRLRDLFEREFHLRATQKIKIPIAFSLSKVDTLFPLFEPGSELHHPGHHPGIMDLDDVQSVHTEIATYLSAWISPNFCRMIDDSFARYHYFGISSLGEQPNAQNRLSDVNPLRVEDPFLWILYQLGLVKGRSRR